ncbi:MAG: type II toxin-antitoxin system VapC family toxin [Chthoniobacterales bacterium]
MNLLDVNVVVAAHREDAENHAGIRAWLESELASPSGLGLSDLVLSGCLRVITHPKIFRQPTSLSEAFEFVEDLRSRPEVHIFAPGPDHWSIFISLCRRSGARGNLVPDAYHAALAMEWGCQWVTLDRGFARFPGLRWRHPLD